MKTLRVMTALLLSGALSGGALAQSDDSGADTLDTPAGLRCSALVEVDAATLPTAIAYIAGYGNGQRDAITFASVGTSEEGANGAPAGAPATSAPATGAAAGATAQTPPPAENQNQTGSDAQPSQVPRPGGPSAAILPAIPVEAVAAACAQSPDSRVLDIITAQGINSQ